MGLDFGSHLLDAVLQGGFILPEGMDEGGGDEFDRQDDLQRPGEVVHTASH